MATEEEVRLGRLVVKQGHATEAQVLDALRERNAKPHGDDLGAILEQRGIVPRAVIAKLRIAVQMGEGASKPIADRMTATTDSEISLGGTREIIARDQLEETLRVLKTHPKVAYRELVRLANDFADTESGVRAHKEAQALEAAHPDIKKGK